MLDDDGGFDHGAVWILLLNPNGTVASHQKISGEAGGFSGALDSEDHFGFSVARVGDLDGDGVTELVVGAQLDDDGGQDRGAVWVLFLNQDGSVRHHQKISSTEGDLSCSLRTNDYWATSVAGIGDLDRDGIADIAVGAYGDDDGNPGDGNWNSGAVWILFLNTSGAVRSCQKLSATQGGFTGSLDRTDYFGWSLASLDDLDGDGNIDLAVGAKLDDDGGFDHGAAWVLFLNQDGTVASYQKISDLAGGFSGTLDSQDHFGSSMARVGDLDGDAVTEFAVGAQLDDDGGQDRGAVWALFLQGACGSNSPDCNRNGIWDTCDITSGRSQDCNSNNVPDECEPDCNGNGVPDDCDPDSCCPDHFPDCNGNGEPDECDCATAPAIVAQPETQSICLPHDPDCSPGNAVLCVEVEEPGKQCYEWQRRNPLDPFDWDPLPPGNGRYEGVTSPCLTIVGVTAADEGDYRVVVSNGCGPTPSDTATLTLLQSVCIFRQPDGIGVPNPECAGTTQQLVVDTIGGGTSVSYQWYRRHPGLPDQPIVGETDPVLLFDPIQTNNAGQYYVIATSDTCGVASRTATVAVYAVPGDIVCAGVNCDPGDTQDGIVDLSDLAKMLTCYGKCSGDPDWDECAVADLNGDGCVNLADLAIQLANFGTRCP